MKKGIRLGAAVVALTFALGMSFVGCGGTTPTEQPKTDAQATTAQATTEAAPAPAKDITIRMGMWGSEAEQKVQKDNAVGSEKVYPGLKIEVVPYPDSQTFWQQLPGQVAAKTAPDIISLSNEGAYEYVAKGAFVAIDDQVKAANIDMTQYSDTAKAVWTFDGKLYGIPTVQAPAMFFINTDMWQAAGLKDYPKTWDEVKTAAKALTKDKVYGMIINIHPYHFTNYALSFGGGWNNGKTINSAANVKAMEFVTSMFAEKLATSPKAEGLGWDGEVFAAKKGAMTTGGWWYKGFLSGSAPDLKYAALPMPKGDAEGCTSISTGIVVLKDTADKDAAVKAAAYMARKEALAAMMKDTGIDPAMPALAADYYTANPEFKATEPGKAFAKDFAYPADTTKFSDAVIAAFEAKILKNDSKSVKAILDELQAQFNK